MANLTLNLDLWRYAIFMYFSLVLGEKAGWIELTSKNKAADLARIEEHC